MKKYIDNDALDLYEVKLTKRQKDILNIIQTDFNGGAYTKEILEESEAAKEISMASLTWNLNTMGKMALLKKSKGTYDGKPYTKYTISEYLKYEAVKIK